MEIRGPGGQPITSLETWRAAMPPRVRDRWVDGRSAKELAHSWFRLSAEAAAMPAELAALLDSRAETRGLVPEIVLPERETPLDMFRGGQRNHDLVVVGRAPAGTVLVAVEAKADETLGPTLAGQINDLPEGSRRRDRLDALCVAVLGRPYDESLAGLRYQLFTAAVGAAIEAARHAARIAVLAVQVFTPSVVAPSSERKRAANDRDLGTFLNVLGQSPAPTGTLVGPVAVSVQAGTEPVSLLVGRIESPLT